MYLPEKLLPETPCNHPLTQDRQDLWDAAQLIRKGGLCKRALHTPDGRHCWAGAIYAGVGYGTIGIGQRFIRAAVQFELATGMKVSAAVDWNNHPETTAEDVISKLEYAALA